MTRKKAKLSERKEVVSQVHTHTTTKICHMDVTEYKVKMHGLCHGSFSSPFAPLAIAPRCICGRSSCCYQQTEPDTDTDTDINTVIVFQIPRRDH